jgi:hypothetical protein
MQRRLAPAPSNTGKTQRAAEETTDCEAPPELEHGKKYNLVCVG